MSERCPWAIRFGANLVTRCFLDVGHDGRRGHKGRGLKDSPTVITWHAGDGRGFESNRADHWAWQVTNHRAKR